MQPARLLDSVQNTLPTLKITMQHRKTTVPKVLTDAHLYTAMRHAFLGHPHLNI